MTIGDILAVIAALALVGAAWGATILIAAVLFPDRTEAASAALKSTPGRCLVLGTAVTVAAAVVVVVFIRMPGPPRLLSYATIGLYGLWAALGSAAIARIAAERMAEIGTQMTPFASLTRGAALYVLAGYTPIIGWFCVAPAALLLSVGAAAAAQVEIRRARPIHQPQTPAGLAGLGQAQ